MGHVELLPPRSIFLKTLMVFQMVFFPAAALAKCNQEKKRQDVELRNCAAQRSELLRRLLSWRKLAIGHRAEEALILPLPRVAVAA